MQCNLELANQSFKLGTAILLGGNQLVQNEFKCIMKQDTQNQIIENLTIYIKFLAKKIITSSKLNEKNQSTRFDDDAAITMNNYDYYHRVYVIKN